MSERVAATGLTSLLCKVIAHCFSTTDTRITCASLLPAATVLCREDCSFVFKRSARSGGVYNHVYVHHIPSWLRKGQYFVI